MVSIWVIIYRSLFNLATLPLIYSLLSISKKARQSLAGRRGWRKRYEAYGKLKREKKGLILFHAASAGEYLCAKPVIEKFYQKGYSCAVTVTSISGYKWLRREKNPHLLFFDYLPADLVLNIRFFYKKVAPKAVIFVKTDLWPNLIFEGAKQKIPLFLISAAISRDSSKFRSRVSRSYHRCLYRRLSGIFSVNAESDEVFSGFFLPGATKSIGDSRYDMVAQRKTAEKLPPWRYPKNAEILVIGSAWPPDIAQIAAPLNKLMDERPNLYCIIAMHEVGEKGLCLVESSFRERSFIRYSELAIRAGENKNQKEIINERIVAVDRIGPLFSLYSYARVSFVGGAFEGKLHNILEPLAMGSPVIFGPGYKKYPEAKEAIEAGVAFPITGAPDFSYVLDELLGEKGDPLSKMATDFVAQHRGVSAAYLNEIEEELRKIEKKRA